MRLYVPKYKYYMRVCDFSGSTVLKWNLVLRAFVYPYGYNVTECT